MVIGILNLPKIYDLYSFSKEIGLSTTIIYLLSKQTYRYYSSVAIPKKKKGSMRQLNIPSFSMRVVQNWIKKNILDNIPISNSAMAFRKGKNYGIRKNAELHKENEFILKIDFKDFFWSINKEKVFSVFKSVGYNNTISEILTNICTYNGSLPQGGVTSPSISNIVCTKLDSRLEGLSSIRNITYSRYADDLIFSSNDEILLKKAKKVICEIINDEGFNVNNDKVRFISPQTRKSITGLLIVKNNVIVPREIKRKVRAMIHKMIVSTDYSDIDKIRGYIAYISSIESDYFEKIKTYIENMVNKEQYRVFEDIVNIYNKNKIIMKSIDMDLVNIESCIEQDEYGLYEYNVAEEYYAERRKFLKKNYSDKVKELDILYKDIQTESIQVEDINDVFF